MVRQPSKTWFETRQGLFYDAKVVIGRFGASHFVDHGDTLFLATGSQCTLFFEQLLHHQIENGCDLHLLIVTTNHHLIDMARLAPPKDDASKLAKETYSELMALYRKSQIVLTGGQIDIDYGATYGFLTILAIQDSAFLPTSVVFSCSGISFKGELSLVYQCINEITTQVALATKQSRKKILFVDSAKFGRAITGCKAGVHIEDIMKVTDEFFIVTNDPEGGDQSAVLDQECENFKQICWRLASNSQFDGKELSLIFVRADGSKGKTISLGSIRQELLRTNGSIVESSRIDDLEIMQNGNISKVKTVGDISYT